MAQNSVLIDVCAKAKAWSLKTLAVSSLASLPLFFQPPASAQSQCVPLQVVGGDQTEITKTVTSVAANILPGARTNWNTDWAVPGGQSFRQFRATVVSEAGGESVDIDLYLKFSDQTSEQTYHGEGVTLRPAEPLVLTASPQPGDEPYQINLRVGGVDADGVTYTASVVGCR